MSIVLSEFKRFGDSKIIPVGDLLKKNELLSVSALFLFGLQIS